MKKLWKMQPRWNVRELLRTGRALSEEGGWDCARIVQRLGDAHVHSAGRDARPNGRRDARRYVVVLMAALGILAGCACPKTETAGSQSAGDGRKGGTREV